MVRRTSSNVVGERADEVVLRLPLVKDRILCVVSGRDPCGDDKVKGTHDAALDVTG